MSNMLSSKLYRITEDLLSHWCPACDGFHLVFINTPSHFGKRWVWNQDPVKPSFKPDLGTFNHCHYRITDGVITFLPDSKHLLAGQDVEMPDIPSDILGKLSMQYFANNQIGI